LDLDLRVYKIGGYCSL